MSDSYCIKLKDVTMLLDAYSERNSTADVTLHCQDGSVKVHRLVLISHSTYMFDLLKDIPAGKKATIFLLSFPRDLVKLVMKLLYKGEVTIESGAMGRITEVMEFLKIQSNVIPPECIQ